MAEASCAHIDAITAVKPAKRRECDECAKIGARWVHLRTCQECGTTHCCDDSLNPYATKHAGEQAPGDRIGGARGALVVLLSG
jgi:hypothetical protein